MPDLVSDLASVLILGTIGVGLYLLGRYWSKHWPNKKKR